jgi:AcrR family transcriptional regulator
MAARPTRPRAAARYDRRRQEVLLGAARVFAVRGYEATSVAELARELDIAAGGLYHYFGGKEALAVEICESLTEPLLEAARELLAASPDEPLRELLRLWVAHVVAHRDHMLVFDQVRHLAEHGAAWTTVRRSRKAFERLLDEVLAQEVAGDPRIALSALLGMVNHVPRWYRPSGRLTPQALADGYCALVI